MNFAPPPLADVHWHDAECGAYSADLALWERLAEEAGGAVLDLGCGTGRVALHLARRGHEVTGVDASPAYAAELAGRAADLPAEAVVGDVREIELGRRFELVIAPMQLVQLFDGTDDRALLLERIADHLAPGGVAALAIVEGLPAAVDGPPPLPDIREVDGWVYSSLPVDSAISGGALRVRRLRQLLSPGGGISEEIEEVNLAALSAEALEREAAEAGLRPLGRRQVDPTRDHVGSTIVLLGRAG